MEIGEPVSIVKLPRTGLAESGRVQFSQVHGVRNGLKRKRQELCAAVDGNSATVYEVQNGRALSSIPIPPDTTFECPPCTLRTKAADGSVLRTTYCATRRREKVVVRAFSERKHGKEVVKSENQYEMPASTSPVIYLEDFHNDIHNGVLVAQQDGSITILSDSDLKLSAQVQLYEPNSQIRVLALRHISPRLASMSVLKNRADLVVGLESNCLLLQCIYYRADDTSKMWYGLSAVSTKLITTLESYTPPIISHLLPWQGSTAAGTNVKVIISAEATSITIKSPQNTMILDTIPIVPNIIAEYPSFASDPSSSISITDSLSLRMSQGEIQIFNLKYRSVQASLDLNNTTLKRKRNNCSISGSYSFVAYFPHLRRAVAQRGSVLFAIDVHLVAASKGSQTLKDSSLLVGNIGRGLVEYGRGGTVGQRASKSSIGVVHTPGPGISNWSTCVKVLDSDADSVDWHQFEEDFFNCLSVNGKSKSLQQNVASMSEAQIDFILSKVFQTRAPPENSHEDEMSGLTVNVTKGQLMHLLTKQGFLTNSRIEKAWSNKSQGLMQRPLRAGAIGLALLQADASLALLTDYLQSAPHIDVSDSAATLKVLLEEALSHTASPSAATMLIYKNQDIPAESNDKQLVLSSNDNSDGIVSDSVTACLGVLLERLLTNGQPRVLTQMQSSLNQTHILALVQFLRQQLFRGGFTRYLQNQLQQDRLSPHVVLHEQPDGQESRKSPQLSLSAIVAFLSMCLDTIGLLGGLATTSEDQLIKSLIPELLSEITSATEAVEDASYLQGLIRETLRYSESCHGQAVLTPVKSNNESASDKSQAPGTIITLYSEPLADGDPDATRKALPLDLRESDLNPMKVRKGGGQVHHRSSREMGMLQDRVRSSYAFERLNL